MSTQAPPAGVRSSPPLGERFSQTIRFCSTPDGVRLAYATVGQGPVLVKAANWLSHLEFDWTSPVWRHWLTGLAENNTLLRYDERGCGLSDWDVNDFNLDAWVMDLETVVDAMGFERFPLLGISQGASIAVEYAVPLDLSKRAPAGFVGNADRWDANQTFQIWTLHAWVYEFNPDGVFAPMNPRVP